MAKKEKKIIKEAWQETKNLKEGEVFLLKDLFKGYKWNRIKTETRSSLGRLFLEKVQKKNQSKQQKKHHHNSSSTENWANIYSADTILTVTLRNAAWQQVTVISNKVVEAEYEYF